MIKSVLLGLLAIAGVIYVIGMVLFGFGWSWMALGGDTEVFWRAGSWQWIFLAGWPALALFLFFVVAWAVGERIRGGKKK